MCDGYLRSFLIVLVCSLSAIACYAEGNRGRSTIIGNYSNYQPLFVDGRKWIMAHGTSEPYFDDRENTWSETLRIHQLISVEVDGDSEVEGADCKRLKIEVESLFPDQEIGEKYMSCGKCANLTTGISYVDVYEYDRKIFVYRNPGPYYEFVKTEDGTQMYLKYGEPYFDLYMDLNVGIGDYVQGLGRIDNEEYIEYNGLISRTISLEGTDLIGLFKRRTWMEGIGSNIVANCFNNYADPDIDWPTIASQSYLVLCAQDGVPFYDIRPLLAERGVMLDDYVTSTKDIILEPTLPSYYTLEGIPVKAPEKGNIYIKIENGKPSKIKY